jgi:Lipopolysaccharide-assembly, LptC-related
VRGAGAAAIALCVLAACNPQPPKATASPSAATARPRAPGTPLVLVVTGRGTAARPVHVFQQVHNRVDYDLLASSYQSEGPQNAMRSVFQNARVTFNDPRGARISATAPQAAVDQTTDAVTLSGGVAAHTATGMTLHCDRLVYRRGSATLHGEGNVVITDPKGFRATGSSFDSDVSLTNIRMR